jgi:hypothetical protein
LRLYHKESKRNQKASDKTYPKNHTEINEPFLALITFLRLFETVFQCVVVEKLKYGPVRGIPDIFLSFVMPMVLTGCASGSTYLSQP